MTHNTGDQMSSAEVALANERLKAWVKGIEATAVQKLNEAEAEIKRLRGLFEAQKIKTVSNARQADDYLKEISRLTYELERWKEVEANRPDWEKLWEEQSEKAEALEAQVNRLLAKEAERITSVSQIYHRLLREKPNSNKDLMAEAEKLLDRDGISKIIAKAMNVYGWATYRKISLPDFIAERIIEEMKQPDLPENPFNERRDHE